jgi:short-subunit dehydrogenase
MSITAYDRGSAVLRARLEALLTGGRAMRARSLDPQRARARLAGRTVLITGASSGIGHALALQLADAGAHTILVARSAAKLSALQAQIEARGASARVYVCDLRSAESTEALLRALTRDDAVVDVLVNNAGHSIRRAIHHA